MRATWVLSALGGLAIGVSCVLPAASVGTGGGGASSSNGTTSTSSGSTSGASSSGGAPMLPVPAFELGLMATVRPTIVAPSGTPEQRHLIHAAGSWWLFFLSSLSTLSVVQTPDTNPTWQDLSPQAVVSSYRFGDANAATNTNTLDGRSFGVDAELGTNPSVHLSLSSTSTTPPFKSHVQDSIMNGVLTTSNPLGSSDETAGSVPDGTVTTITSTAAFGVVDFGAILGSGTEAEHWATVFEVQSGGSVVTTTDLDSSQAAVTSRAVLPLGPNLVALWNNEGTGLSFSAYTNGQWGAFGALDTTTTQPVIRQWAACATALAPTQAHAMWWSGGSFHHWTLDGGTPNDGWRQGSVPMNPPAAMVPATGFTEMFLACGANEVVAFTIAADGSILEAVGSPPPTGNGWQWGGWMTAVDKLQTGGHRCFLSGDNRVVSPGAAPQVGLLWTQSSDPLCKTPETADLWTAFVPI